MKRPVAPGALWLQDTGAFVGTNPTDESIVSGLPVIHLESPKWQGESHPLSREELGYAVEFAPFARDINELSRGTAVGTNLPMKNSHPHLESRWSKLASQWLVVQAQLQMT